MCLSLMGVCLDSVADLGWACSYVCGLSSCHLAELGRNNWGTSTLVHMSLILCQANPGMHVPLLLAEV